MSDYLSNLVRSGQKRAAMPAAAANAIEETVGSSENQVNSSRFLADIGFFDTAYYGSQYADVAQAGIDLFEHFFLYGYKEGRRPNPCFDPLWHIQTYPESTTTSANPLLHYALQGEAAGNRPSEFFDPVWYKGRYNLDAQESPLLHYLKNNSGAFSPIPEFDAEYYLTKYPDIAATDMNLFEHYVRFGYKEGRNPSANFDTDFYTRRYLKGIHDVNPLIHYLHNKGKPGVHPTPNDDEQTPASLLRRFSRPGKDFAEFRPLPPKAKKRAKILAYYLPQFHSFPENDRWWGAGFTEWTNIARGQPRFHDHYQPRVPRDLGFYSLDDVNVMRRQVAMALGAGLHGFVFYYYWFNRKRLLEKPVEQFLKARDIEMPFCLMWANESWTRRWDGLEGEVLIAQDYLAEDDGALCADFARHFQDPRYIRIDGRPLLMIYRPGLMSNVSEVVEKWRKIFRKEHKENPILIMSQSFNDFDPTKHGLDGAIEFPPHKLTQDMQGINKSVEIIDDTFNGRIHSYDEVVNKSLSEPIPSFPLIKTVVPSWDNDARRQGTGLAIHGSTPKKYEYWLSQLIERTSHSAFFGERFVCVNAWNEWCEGAYLEPDVHFGSAYLNATARAVAGLSGSDTRLLLVGHDAFPSGAQHLLLNIGRTLRGAFGLKIEYVLLGEGILESEYRAVAPVTIVRNQHQLASIVGEFKARGVTAAIVNTSASGEIVPLLADAGIRVAFLIHELPRILKEKGLEEAARRGIERADKVVFPARFVQGKVLGRLSIASTEKIVIKPQGTYKKLVNDPKKAAALRRELGVPENAPLVLGAGYADLRKGFDLFLQTWRQINAHGGAIHFCWVGGIDPSLKEWLGSEIEIAMRRGSFHMPGYRTDADVFFAASDAFALTSREDPFPTVALEALSIGVPVVAFEASGGIPEFLRDEGLGHVVPFADVQEMAKALRRAVADRSNHKLAARAEATIRSKFDFGAYVSALLEMAMPDLPKISVVVPNFNYAHCLSERLCSIFDQTHPTLEIIVLDDASSDDSLAVIDKVAEERERDLTLIINDQNSGSVFRQWARAAEMAQGEFVWIAEADDLAEAPFLLAMVEAMKNDPAIAFGFCDSKSIDAEGAPVYASYKPYFASIEPNALTQDEIFEGADFVRRFLSVKNTILNVSSVLWRRDALRQALKACEEELRELRMAGDWRIYLECLSKPGARVAYRAATLNIHRRHAQSVTHSLKAQKHIDEIQAMHRKAKSAFKLAKETTDAQRTYAAEVKEQLLGKPQGASQPQ